MIEYYIIFFGCSAISLAGYLSSSTKLQSNLLVSLIGLILTNFVGLRYASVDYYSYQEIFYSIGFEHLSFPFYSTRGGTTTGNEFIFATIISLFNAFALPFEAFIFFAALASISLKLYFFKTYSHTLTATLILYLGFLLLKEMGQIRNALAGTVALFSILYASNHQALKFTALSALAFGIQSFALILIPFYVFHKLIFSRSILLLSILSCSFLFAINGATSHLLFLTDLLPAPMQNKVMGYLENSEPRGVTILTIWILSFATYLFICYRQNTEKYKLHNVFCSMYCYGMILYFLFYDFPIIGGRTFEFIIVYPMIILMPLILTHFRGNQKLLPLGLLLAFSFLYFHAVVPGANEYITILNN